MKFGVRVLIVKGKHSGQQADIVYEYWRDHKLGLRQMANDRGHPPPGYESVYMAVPVFDNCGEPKVIELRENEFARLKK